VKQFLKIIADSVTAVDYRLVYLLQRY